MFPARQRTIRLSDKGGAASSSSARPVSNMRRRPPIDIASGQAIVAGTARGRDARGHSVHSRLAARGRQLVVAGRTQCCLRFFEVGIRLDRVGLKRWKSPPERRLGRTESIFLFAALFDCDAGLSILSNRCVGQCWSPRCRDRRSLGVGRQGWRGSEFVFHCDVAAMGRIVWSSPGLRLF